MLKSVLKFVFDNIGNPLSSKKISDTMTSLGRKINSMTLKAIAEDSRNDVIATSAVLIATLVEHGMGYQIDGFMGLVVSLFVLYSGISLARETISPLLGEGADTELHDKLTKYIQS